VSNLLFRSDLQVAQRYFRRACRLSRDHDALAAQALGQFGNHGPPISGCVREHFPDNVKNKLRRLAARVTSYSDAAYAARPKRVRIATMRALSRAIAREYGYGFYGPQL